MVCNYAAEHTTPARAVRSLACSGISERRTLIINGHGFEATRDNNKTLLPYSKLPLLQLGKKEAILLNDLIISYKDHEECLDNE